MGSKGAAKPKLLERPQRLTLPERDDADAPELGLLDNDLGGACRPLMSTPSVSVDRHGNEAHDRERGR
jgi:hypothetical protein